jgi:ribosome-binding factor A
MSRRTEKVAAVLQQEIGFFILKMELPALTTISKVEVTPDLKWSKIWITVMGDKDQQQNVLDLLHESLFEMQGELNRKLEMKFVPRIKFVIDHGEEYADHINELLRKTKED